MALTFDVGVGSTCSTSPTAEPAHFCASLRASLRRMRDNPQPLTTLFPGGRARVYRLEGDTWQLVGPDMANTRRGEIKTCSWGLREFRAAFM